jgi:hypothetical protein
MRLVGVIILPDYFTTYRYYYGSTGLDCQITAEGDRD